jgi:hypothetical protein
MAAQTTLTCPGRSLQCGWGFMCAPSRLVVIFYGSLFLTFLSIAKSREEA